MKYTLSVVLILFTFSLFAQYTIVSIDNQTYGPNEPTIYINPFNPAQIVAGSNINNHYVSHDTGRTWQLKTLKSSFGVYGDPVVYADEYGNFYYCHLSATRSKTYPNWIDRIVVQKSTDGGLNFNDGTAAGLNGDKEQDKHWIVKDQHSMLHKDNMYMTWTEFDHYGSNEPTDHSRIRFSRSVNGAESFEQAITISDTVGDCVDDDNTLEGATPAIGKNGEIYVAWAGYGNIYFDKSPDGGRTWGKDQVIAIQDGGWSLDFNHIYRSNGLPFLVADHSRSKYKNRLYLVWGETVPELGGEIKLKYSDNGGDTWSPEITVNACTVGDQFLPHIAIDQSDGTVYVVYYDRCNRSANTLMDVYVAYSEDGGQTFTNKLVTAQPISPPGKEVFFGDYNGISAHRGVVRPIWTGTDKTLKGTTTIQTALLSKELLKTQSQVLTDTVFYNYFKNETNNTFVLYSTKSLEYTIKLKVKKHKYSVIGKTYRQKGVIELKNDGKPLTISQSINIPTIKGNRAKLKIQLKGKYFEKRINTKIN